MAAVASTTQISAIAVLGCRSLSSLPRQSSSLSKGVFGDRKAYSLSRNAQLVVRASDNDGVSPSGLREAVDKATKVNITREAILQNQENNESEKRSVFGTVPKSGGSFPRPEIERRPETGDKGFRSLFAFDGAAPETINGRLAMFGFVWAFLAEKATGLTVQQQLFSPGATGLVFFVGAVELLTYASLIPIMNGESTDARRFGPFTAKAERWNGRLAMIGFASLLIDEAIRQSPVFFH